MCYSADTRSIDESEAQATRDDGCAPLKEVVITSISYPEDTESAISANREKDGGCNLNKQIRECPALLAIYVIFPPCLPFFARS